MATITGGIGNDPLTGTNLADTIDGGLGADAMSGLKGNDIYIVDNVGDTAIELPGEGIDLVKSSVTFTLGANVENLTLTGGGNIDGTGNTLNNILLGNGGNNQLAAGDGNDQVNGGDGNDLMFGQAGNDSLVGGIGDDQLQGGTGNDTLDGGAGNDTYYVDSIHDKVVESISNAVVGGTDLVYSEISFSLAPLANVEQLVLSGIGDTNATGNKLGNLLFGNTGDNTLDGGAGNDQMTGNTGNDTYLVDNFADTVVENVGEGFDTIVSKVALSTAIANIECYIFNTATPLIFTGSADFDEIHGGSGNDGIAGGGGAGDLLFGGLGNDALSGGNGNDDLDGGKGVDWMAGGLGNDIYTVDNIGDQIVEGALGGQDTVFSSISIAALWSEVEDASLTGLAALNLTGNAANNILSGNNGNNLIDGGLGADTMFGAKGNDTYFVDNAGDTATEFLAAGGGTDLVKSAVNFDLGANIENLTLTGSAVSGGGNELANIIIGNGADNLLNGREGNDNLTGGDGNDQLFGGLGNDTLTGGLGNDHYTVDSAKDQVIEAAGGGHDVVHSTVSFSLAAFANVEDLELTDIASIDATGNALANTLIGNLGDNRLNGGKGADDMFGGAGSDTYYIDNVGDQVHEGADVSSDIIVSSIALSTAVSGVESYIFKTAVGVHFTGSTGDNQIDGGTGADVLHGNGGSIDHLNGNGGNDHLTAGAGDDRLDGGSGADEMTGGDGNDIYFVDNAGDQIIETGLGAGGTDTVASKVSIAALWDSVEIATLDGFANINLTGNDDHNILLGNSGSNIINGKAGDDAIQGGLGSDTLTGGLGSDAFYFEMSGNDGKDTIKDFEHAIDQLWFLNVADNNGDSVVDLADLQLDVTGVVDKGAGKDVVVSLDNGSSITFTGEGTGSVGNLVDLVGTASQIHIV